MDWREGQPISCAGIRWPQQNTKIRSGAVGTFNAFGASDWDVMERIADGVVTSRDVSDSCTYTWTATGGTFLSANGASTSGKGLATQWRAPVVSVSTSITLTLVVDDQDGANIGVGKPDGVMIPSALIAVLTTSHRNFRSRCRLSLKFLPFCRA